MNLEKSKPTVQDICDKIGTRVEGTCQNLYMEYDSIDETKDISSSLKHMYQVDKHYLVGDCLRDYDKVVAEITVAQAPESPSPKKQLRELLKDSSSKKRDKKSDNKK